MALISETCPVSIGLGFEILIILTIQQDPFLIQFSKYPALLT